MREQFPELTDTRGAATLLGLSPRSLEGWRVTGDGPRFVRCGAGKRARIRYRLSDLRDWLDRQTRESTADVSAA